MKFRSLLSFFALLLLPLLAVAQPNECLLDAELVGLVVDSDSATFYLAEVVVTRRDGQGGGWVSGNQQGAYGATVQFIGICGEPLILEFQDRQDSFCITEIFIESPDCQPDPCFNFGLEPLTATNGCLEEGPRYQIFGGTFPMEVLLSSPVATILQTLDGPDREIDFSDVPANIYFVTVTSADGCQTSANFTVTDEPCGSIRGASWLDQNFDGIRQDNEMVPVGATVALLASDGEPLRFVQTNNNGVYFFNDVPAGAYRVRFWVNRDDLIPTLQNVGPEATDSDINDNLVTDPITVAAGQPVADQGDAGWRLANCSIGGFSSNPDCGQSNGSIRIDSIVGVLPVIFSWSHGPEGGDQFDNLAAGTYTVTATFADGCVATETFILRSELRGYSLSGEGDLCTDGTVTLSVDGPSDDEVTYAWNTGATTSSVEVTSSGFYRVTVVGDAGCQTRLDTFLRPNFSSIALDSAYFLDCTTGEVTIDLPDIYDAEFLTWTFNNEIITGVASLTLGQAGFLSITYEVDSSGTCSHFGFTSIVDPRLGDDLELVVSNQDSSACDDIALLSVLGDATEGQGLTYEWSGPDGVILYDRPFNRVLAVGLYQVVVSSVCGTQTLQYDFGDGSLICQDVSGRLFLDIDGGCSLSDGDVPVPGNLIEITSLDNGEQYFAFTNQNGEWGAELPEGNYSVRAPYDELAAVGACTEVTVTLAGGSVADVNVFLPVLEECPLLLTDVGSNRFRRCFRNSAWITYENRGTGTANDAELTLIVDDFFTDLSASVPFTQDGNVLTFQLGDVPVFAREIIRLNFTVSCESELGQLHCLDASITPNEPCIDPANWNGALVNVSGAECDGDEIVFTIENVGETVMSVPVSYVIIEDGIMMLPAPTTEDALEPGEEITITLTADGSTYQVVANQEPNAPASSRPSSLVEGCNGTTAGFGNLVENGNQNPGESTFCRENIGSYDPNEKLGFPTGFGAEHDIEPRTTITYDLYFQNTGTDTAFTVVIRDTIPEELDLCSIKLGTASHPYTATLDSQRVLTFTFNNILLPDSTTDLAGSQGVVRFVIDPVETLERGDRFRNRAGIYFDFNEPVITDYMNHRIAPEPILLATRAEEATAVTLSVFPNPVADRLNVRLPETGIGTEAQWVISDLLGREWQRQSVRQAAGNLSVGQLPTGYYLLLLEDGGLIRGRSAFVVAR